MNRFLFTILTRHAFNVICHSFNIIKVSVAVKYVFFVIDGQIIINASSTHSQFGSFKKSITFFHANIARVYRTTVCLRILVRFH